MGPTSGTRAASVNATPVASVAPGTAIDLNFANNAEATFTINYPDAGQLNLHASHLGAGREGGTLAPGADLSVSRPAGLGASSAAAPGGATGAAGVRLCMPARWG